LKTVDVAENADTQEEGIGKFFGALDAYNDEGKLQLLHDVLQEGEIALGNGGTKKLKEVADDFSEYVEQDNGSWKIKEKELPEGKQYLAQFLNQKNSSLAYLVQRAANFINIQAARGYGDKHNAVDRIVEDKIL
jgi:truncated hemoglobin YjbI